MNRLMRVFGAVNGWELVAIPAGVLFALSAFVAYGLEIIK